MYAAWFARAQDWLGKAKFPPRIQTHFLRCALQTSFPFLSLGPKKVEKASVPQKPKSLSTGGRERLMMMHTRKTMNACEMQRQCVEFGQ